MSSLPSPTRPAVGRAPKSVVADAVPIGAHGIWVELDRGERPRRSALWEADLVADHRRAALTAFIDGLVESGYQDRFIVDAFLEPVITENTPDGSPQADVWAQDRAPSASGAAGTILPPAAVPLAHPVAALDAVCQRDHPLTPWLRTLGELALEEPTIRLAARAFRYDYRARSDAATSFSAITFAEQQTGGALRSTGAALVASFRTGSAAGSEGDWISVVPVSTISGIRFRAVHPAKAGRLSRGTEGTARLISERGYGELKVIEVTVDSDDGWRPVRLSCVLEPVDGEDALLRDVEAVVAGLPGVDASAPARWTAFRPLSIGADGVRELELRFVDAVPLGIDGSALAHAGSDDVTATNDVPTPAALAPILSPPDATDPVVDEPDPAMAAVASACAPADPPAFAPPALPEVPTDPPEHAEPQDVPVPHRSGVAPVRSNRIAWIIGSVAALIAVVVVLLVRASTSSDRADPPPPVPSVVTTAVTAAAPTTTAAAAADEPTTAPTRDRPIEWPSPTSALSAETSRFVADAGRSIAAIVAVIDALVDGPTNEAACRSAAVELDGAATPEQFGAVIVATPDPVLAGLLAGLMRVTADAIAACTTGASDLGTSFDEVRETLAYVLMRERDLGVG
jgi:hypothetical protein